MLERCCAVEGVDAADSNCNCQQQSSEPAVSRRCWMRLQLVAATHAACAGALGDVDIDDDQSGAESRCVNVANVIHRRRHKRILVKKRTACRERI